VDTALNLVTIIVAIALICIILLQKRETSISGAFGGNSDSIQRTRRGFDKTLFQATIMVGGLFLIFCILSSIFLSS
jgi:preprotein translocase subunit SecG